MIRNTAIGSEIVAFGGALRRYGQVMLALLRREEERRRQAPLKAIVAMMEPIFLIGMISGLYWLLDRANSPVGGSPMLFLASGLYIKYYFIHIGQRMGRTRNRKFPVEHWLDHIIVFLLMRFVDYVILGIVLFSGLAIFVDPNAIPYDISRILEAMGLMTMLGFGWGMIITVSKIAFGVPGFVFSVINRVLIVMSGAMFVIDFMPPDIRYWMSFIPTAHAIILFRQGIYPNYPNVTLDMTYLITWSVCAVLFGMVIERVTRRQMERR